MRMLVVVLFMAMVFMAGCKQPGMNVQRSGLRDVGDIASTLWLENIEMAKVEKRKGEIIETCDKLLEFLKTGQVIGLTSGALIEKLIGKVPTDYIWIPQQALVYANLANVDTNIVGDKNKKRLVAFIVGMKRGGEGYLSSDRAEH